MGDKVFIDDLKISNESMFGGVTYNGVPFTGTAYEHSDRFHSEYSYKNGFGHGRCFSVFENGQLHEEFYLDNGETTESTSWNENGIKRDYFRKSPLLHQFWNESGVLLIEENETTKKEWYNTSKQKSSLVKKSEFIYFSESGQWVVKIKTHHDYVVLEKKQMLFNEPYINDHYMDLLQDYDFYKYFILWLIDLDGKTKAKVICSMINSNTLWHKYNGINLARQYKVKEAVPLIKLEYDNNKYPPKIRDIRGTSTVGFADTIAERAQIALREI